MLLSRRPPGQAGCLWLPGSFGKLQPPAARTAALSWEHNAQAGAELEGLCLLAAAPRVQLCTWLTLDPDLHTILSQIPSSDWLKILLSHQSHTAQLRVISFLSKRGK